MTLISDITPRAEVGVTSYSALTLHRSCPQKWSYNHLFGLEQPPVDDPAPALRFGTWWHALRAADAIERGRALGSLKYAPLHIKCSDVFDVRVETRIHKDVPCDLEERKCHDWSHFDQVEDLRDKVLRAADDWNDRLPEYHVEKWVGYFGTADVARMLKNLDLRWRTHHKEELKHQHPIGVEVGWGRQLPGSETRLVGYTDEVQYDERRGMVVVVDHKTTKRLGTQSTADDLLDSQLDLNAWGLYERIEEWGVAQPSGIAFDRVLSAPPTKPKLTTRGARSKTVTNYDLLTYLAFCKSPEAIEAGYKPEQSEIDRISSPSYGSKWFQRPVRPVNRNLARVHLQAAVDTALDAQATILRVQKRGEAPRNFTGAACDWCSFAKLCRAQMIGGPLGEYEVTEYGLQVKGPKASKNPPRQTVLAEVSG